MWIFRSVIKLFNYSIVLMIQREKSLDLFSIYWSLLLQKIHAMLSRKFSFKGLGVLQRLSLNDNTEPGNLMKKKNLLRGLRLALSSDMPSWKKFKKKKIEEEESCNVSAALEGWPTSLSFLVWHDTRCYSLIFQGNGRIIYIYIERKLLWLGEILVWDTWIDIGYF